MVDNNERRYLLDKMEDLLKIIGDGHVGKKERAVRRIAKAIQEFLK